MAISNVRTGYINGTTSGWAARSLFYANGALYLVVSNTSNNKIEVYKSTNWGGTWNLQDGSNSVSHTGATASYDANMALSGSLVDAIAIVYRTATNTIRVRLFDTSTDTWASVDVGAANASTVAHAGFGLGVAVRSDGDIIVMLRNLSDDLYYTVYEGSTWSSLTAVNTTNTSIPLSITMTANSDMAHMLFYEQSATDLSHRSLDSSNTLGTLADIDSAVSTANIYSLFLGYKNDSGTHRLATIVLDGGGELDFAYTTSSSAPAWTKVSSLSPTTVTDPGKMGGIVVPFETHWIPVWSGDGRGEIHRDFSDDFGSPTFTAADKTPVTGLANDPSIYAIETPTGVLAVYTDHTAPSVGVDTVWAVGGPPSTYFVGNVGFEAYNSTSTSSRTITLTGDVVVGQTLIASSVCNGSPTLTSITDSQGNTWSSILQVNNGSNLGSQLTHSHITNALTAGDTVTFTWSASGTSRYTSLDVFEGLDTSATWDVSTTATGTSTESGLTLGTSAQAEEIVFMVSSATAVGAVFGGPNQVTLKEQGTAVGSNDRLHIATYKEVGSIAAHTMLTQFNASRTYASVAASLKIAVTVEGALDVSASSDLVVAGDIATSSLPFVDAAATSSGGVNVSSTTFSHTTGASDDRALLVALSVRAAGGHAASTSVTWNGVGLTYVDRAVIQSDHSVELWILLNPAASTTANVVASYPANRAVVVGAMSFARVHQTTPLGTVAKTGGNPGVPSVTVTSDPTDLVLAAVQRLTNATLTPDSPQTQLYQYFATNEVQGAASVQPSTGTTTTSAWTTTSSYHTSLGVAIKPAGFVAPEELGELVVSAASDLTAAGGRVRTGGMTISGDTLLLEAGVVTRKGVLTVSGDTTLTVAGGRVRTGALTGSGETTFVVAGTATRNAALTVSGETNLVVAGIRNKVGAFAVSGDSSALIGSEGSVPAAFTVSGETGFVAAGVRAKSGALALVAESNLVGDSTSNVPAALALVAESNLVVAGQRGRLGAFVGSGETSVVIGSTANVPAAFAVSGDTTFLVAGALNKNGSLAVSGDGALTVAANVVTVGALTVSGDTNAVIGSEGDVPAALVVSASSDMAVAGDTNTAHSGALSLVAESNAIFAGVRTFTASHVVSGDSNAVFGSAADVPGALPLVAESSLTVAGTRIKTTAPTYSGDTTFSLSAIKTHAANVPLVSESDLLVSGVRTKTGAIALSGDSTAVFGSEGDVPAALVVSGSTTFSTDSIAERLAALDVSGTGSATIAAGVVKSAECVLTLESSFDAAGTVTRASGAILDASSDADFEYAVTKQSDLTLSTTSGGDVHANLTIVSELDLDGDSSMFIATSRVVDAAFDLVAETDLTSSGFLTLGAVFDVTGNSSLALTANVDNVISLALDAASNFVSGQELTRGTGASFVGETSVVIGVAGDIPGAANFSAESLAAIDADLEIVSSLAVSSDSTLTATGARLVEGLVALSAETTLDLNAVRDYVSSLSVDGDTTFALSAINTLVADLTLAGETNLIVSSDGDKEGAVDLSASSDGTTLGVVNRAASFTISASTDLSVGSDLFVNAVLDLTVDSDFASTAGLTKVTAPIDLDARTTFDLAADNFNLASMSLSAASDLTVYGIVDELTDMLMSASSNMVVSSVLTREIAIAFEGNSNTSINYTRVRSGALAVSGDTEMLVSGSIPQSTEANFSSQSNFEMTAGVTRGYGWILSAETSMSTHAVNEYEVSFNVSSDTDYDLDGYRDLVGIFDFSGFSNAVIDTYNLAFLETVDYYFREIDMLPSFIPLPQMVFKEINMLPKLIPLASRPEFIEINEVPRFTQVDVG